MADSATLPTIDLDYPFECVLENYSTAYLEILARGSWMDGAKRRPFDDLTQFMEHRFDEALGEFYSSETGSRYDARDLRETRAIYVRENLKFGPSLARCLKIDAIDWVMENADA